MSHFPLTPQHLTDAIEFLLDPAVKLESRDFWASDEKGLCTNVTAKDAVGFCVVGAIVRANNLEESDLIPISHALYSLGQENPHTVANTGEKFLAVAYLQDIRERLEKGPAA